MGRRTMVVAAVFVLLAAGAAAAQSWQRGVDEFARGAYHDHTVLSYGVNGPGVTVVVRDKANWPEVRLAGLLDYIYVFYGAQRDEWAQRLGAFGAVVPHPRAKPRQTAVRVDWNHREHTYEWDDEAGSQTMAVGASNLFPGFQVQTDARELMLFHGMPKQPPSCLAHAERSGGKVIRVALPEEPRAGDYVQIDSSAMTEPWLLAWFADSQGMKDVRYGGTIHATYHGADVPWLIVLQRRPHAVAVGEYGLRMRFPGPCQTVIALPLFGRLLQSPDKTRPWRDGLPDDVLRRVRFWTSVARRIPQHCREDFCYDRGTGTLTVRDTYSYREIKDDWNTPGKQIAPLSPAVGICRMYRDAHRFPLEFVEPLEDAGYDSQWGPYYYVPDADVVTYRVSGVGKYLDETLTRSAGRLGRTQSELPLGPKSTQDCSRTPDNSVEWLGRTQGEAPLGPADDMVRQLEERVAALAARPPTLRHAVWSPNENGAVFIGSTAEQVTAIARCWPWLSEKLQAQVRPMLRQLCVERLLDKDSWELIGTAYGVPARTYRYKRAKLECWMDVQHARVLYALGTYAHYTGDWDLVRESWPLLQGAVASYAVKHDFASLLNGTSHVPLRLHCGMNGLIGAARMARKLDDGAWEQRAAYLLGQSLLAWFAQWKGPNYAQHCEPLEAEWHALHCYRTVYGERLPRSQTASGTYLNTRTQSWYPAEGFTWCTDPTLFSAPWSEVFLEASPELLRFYDDYFRADVIDQLDYVSFLWPLTFSNAFSYQTGLGQWGMSSPYFRVAALMRRDSPTQLRAMLPDAQCPEDPFYIENLLAILQADGRARWARCE
jgi:hypothetical protein